MGGSGLQSKSDRSWKIGRPFGGVRSSGRAVILGAAGVTTGFLGWIQAWSVLSGALIDAFQWSPQWLSLAYSLFTLFSFTAQNLAGQLQKRLAPGTIFLMASASLLVGWSLPTVAGTELATVIGVGMFGGIGQGLAYNTSLSVAARWFPDRRGLANGVCIGCIGLAPLVWAPVAHVLVQSFGVGKAFLTVSVLMSGAVLATSRIVRYPGFPASTNPQAMEEPLGEGGDGQRLVDVAKQPAFWALWAMLFFGSIPGTSLIAHLSEMAQHTAGVSSGAAALLVSVMAAVNFVARLGFGAWSDKAGRMRSAYAVYLLVFVGASVFALVGSNVAAFTAAVAVVSLGYGGMMVVVASICSDVFGSQQFGRNYAALFSAFTAAAWVGPNIASIALEAFGSYMAIYMVCAVSGLLGLCATALLHREYKNKQN